MICFFVTFFFKKQIEEDAIILLNILRLIPRQNLAAQMSYPLFEKMAYHFMQGSLDLPKHFLSKPFISKEKIGKSTDFVIIKSLLKFLI